MLPNAEATIRAKAAALGLTCPAWPISAYPEVFAQWADRVALADVRRARGKLTEADLDECDRALGLPASRVPPKPARAYRAPNLLEQFRTDPVAGIERAVRQFAGYAA